MQRDLDIAEMFQDRIPMRQDVHAQASCLERSLNLS